MRKHSSKQSSEGLSDSRKDIRRLIRTGFFIVVSLWVMFALIIGVKTTPTPDMSPTLKLGDKVIYSRVDKKPIAKDVIVLKKDEDEFISRVVAVPGDTVEITEEGNLIVNGNLIVDEKISSPTYPALEKQSYPVTLGEKEYFVLGDNRLNSVDSRYFGIVKANEIKGTLIMVIRLYNF